jgi:hypothetical protein
MILVTNPSHSKMGVSHVDTNFRLKRQYFMDGGSKQEWGSLIREYTPHDWDELVPKIQSDQFVPPPSSSTHPSLPDWTRMWWCLQAHTWKRTQEPTRSRTCCLWITCGCPPMSWSKQQPVMSVFFTPVRYKEVKIVCHSFEVVLRTMKHTMIYPCVGPSLKVIALRSVVWYWRWTCVTRGEQRAWEVHVVKGENGYRPSYLKGRSPFIGRSGVC